MADAERVVALEVMIKRLLRALHTRSGKQRIANEARALLGMKPGERIRCEHWFMGELRTGLPDGIDRQTCRECNEGWFMKDGQRLTWEQARAAGWFAK